MRNQKIKTNVDNFLHCNPQLYESFYGDEDLKMAHFLHRILKEFCAGSKILDVGCGLGREVHYLSKQGYHVTGMDNTQEMLLWAREHFPNDSFIFGDLKNFNLNEKFDGIYCVGSSFLYNTTTKEILRSLNNFRQHLNKKGFLYLDMRNAAFFLTEKGQEWLKTDMTEQILFNGKPAISKVRFEIDFKNQLLQRDYYWKLGDEIPIMEHLIHRLIFPQEMITYLEISGFEIQYIFDHPAPHTENYDSTKPLIFHEECKGTRMQIIAYAV